MNPHKKMIYGVLNDTVYAASGPALLRVIAGNVLGSDAPVSMLQLRTWFGDDLADGLVRRFEEGEEEDSGALPRPIADETVLTHDNIYEDAIEDCAWIENTMWEEFPGNVKTLGGPQSYRSGLGIKVEKLAEFERLMHAEGIELVRDDHLISLIEGYDLTPHQMDKIIGTINGLLHS